MPAKAGIHFPTNMDSGFRRNDGIMTHYGPIHYLVETMSPRIRSFLLLNFAALQVVFFGAISRSGEVIDVATSRSVAPSEAHAVALIAKNRPSENAGRRFAPPLFTIATAITVEIGQRVADQPLATISIPAFDAGVFLPNSRAPPARS